MKFSLINYLFLFAPLVLLATASNVYQTKCGNYTQIEIMFVVDTTVSMESRLNFIRLRIPQVSKQIQSRLPGSRFGLATFNDKWEGCIGYTDFKNYCARIELPLTENVNALQKSVWNIKAINGDSTLKEDVLGGMLLAADSPSVGWNKENKRVARLMVVVTDSPYQTPVGRVPSYGRNPCLKYPLKPNKGTWNYDCNADDYPSIDQVKKVLRKNLITPMFLTLEYTKTAYVELIQQFKRGGKVATIICDCSNFAEAFWKSILNVECPVHEPLPPKENHELETTMPETILSTDDHLLTSNTTSLVGGTTSGAVAAGVTSAAAAAALAAAGGIYYLMKSKATAVEGVFEGDLPEDFDTDRDQNVHVQETAFS